MKKMLFFAFIAVFVAISTNAGIDQDYKGLVGEWKFEVSSAPYGYEKGMLYFFEKDNNLEGKVKFGEGNKIIFINILYVNVSIYLNLYVVIDHVDVKFMVEL